MSEFNIEEKIVESYEKAYSELETVISSLDMKAQSLAQVNGIIIAGIFAFATKEKLILGGWDKLFVVISIIGIFISMICYLQVVWIKWYKGPPFGESFEKVVEILQIKTSQFSEENVQALNKNVSKIWRRVFKDMRQYRNEKASSLLAGQMILTLSFIPLIILLLGRFC